MRIHAAYSHTVFSDLSLAELMQRARSLRDEGKGRLVTYSPKVFIPLTKLCRDVCHYCTFAAPPRRGERAYMTADEVLDVARAGAAAGCGTTGSSRALWASAVSSRRSTSRMESR